MQMTIFRVSLPYGRDISLIGRRSYGVHAPLSSPILSYPILSIPIWRWVGGYIGTGFVESILHMEGAGLDCTWVWRVSEVSVPRKVGRKVGK